MNTHWSRLALLCALSLSSVAGAAPYTYHGDLMDGEAPAEGAYDLRVRAFGQPGATKALAEATELLGVAMVEGHFSVDLDLPEDADGTTWVEVAVRKAGTQDNYVALGDPRPVQKVNSTCPGAWALDGNTGVPAGSFIGLADPANLAPLLLKAGNATLGRLEPALEFGQVRVASIAFGSPLNVASGFGATVSGGGGYSSGASPCPNCKNTATGGFSTVGGGFGVHAENYAATASGGQFNSATASYTTISGGQKNDASADSATVAGGSENRASGILSNIGGGGSNYAKGIAATVAGGAGNEANCSSSLAGGASNVAEGDHSAATGGLFNCAGGDRAWAGGRRAKVRAPSTDNVGTKIFGNACFGFNADDTDGDEGTFAWADNQDADFVSTGPNQFLVRARGSMGINRAPAFSDTELTVGPSSASDGTTSLSLINSTSTALLQVDFSGDTVLNPLIGDLLLFTGAPSKYIYTNDKFGVGQRPVTNSLEVLGSASKSVAGNWLANSDRRIKRDIAPIPGALDTILRLRPVTFRYDARYRATHRGIDDKPYFNVIAQEFAEVFPDAVKGSGEYLDGKSRTPDNEILQVDTYPAQIVSIAAIQELAVQDDQLRDAVGRLERDNAALRQEVRALQQDKTAARQADRRAEGNEYQAVSNALGDLRSAHADMLSQLAAERAAHEAQFARVLDRLARIEASPASPDGAR